MMNISHQQAQGYHSLLLTVCCNFFAQKNPGEAPMIPNRRGRMLKLQLQQKEPKYFSSSWSPSDCQGELAGSATYSYLVVRRPESPSSTGVFRIHWYPWTAESSW